MLESLRKDDSFDEAYLLLFQTYLKKGSLGQADGVFSTARSQVEQPFVNRMKLELATLHWSNGRYELAQKQIQNLKGNIYGVKTATQELVVKSIEFSFQSNENPREIKFEELPKPLNQFQGQYFPSLTADGMLIFTGRSRGRRGENEDLFISKISGKSWAEPKSLSDSINTDQFNEGTASVAADGFSIVFTGCNRPDGLGSCDLYASYNINGAWTKPENLGKAINTAHWESQPSLSIDGRKLFFVSTRPGGKGGQDIWMSTKASGKWSKAVNLGPVINSELDDCSPFIHPDGETFFYASSGKAGLGGFDLFKSRLEGNIFDEPQNLGFPINTHANQVGYTVGLDGWAYYSDNNLMGQTKLYRFKMPEDLLPKTKSQVLSGIVKNSETGEALSADVYLMDLDKDSVIMETHSKTDGVFRFLTTANEQTDMVYVKNKGYSLFKRPLEQIQRVNDLYVVELNPLRVGQKIALNNILFEFNKSTLDSKAKKELMLAMEFIKDNPQITVEIGGHSDTIGDDGYNLTLSQNRAKTVYEYFIYYGINKERLSFKGYGESQPIRGDNSEILDELSRRIEIKIISL